MTKRIDWSEVEGFLLNLEYSAHYYLIFRDFENQFIGADQIVVKLKERPYSMLAFPIDQPIRYSEDGKKVTIIFTKNRYYDRSGRPKSLPEPSGVFRELRFLMSKAADEYKAKFPSEVQND
jgi:hypothetical protein